VLVVERWFPDPQRGGGYPRTHSLVHSLLATGCHVVYYAIEEVGTAGAAQLFGENFEPLPGNGSVRGLEPWLEAHGADLVGCVVSRPRVMREFAELLDRRPLLKPRRVVYDVEALTARRQGESSAIDEQVGYARWADVIMTVSAAEARYFTDADHGPVHVLPHSVRPSPTTTPFADRRGLLFVGPLIGESPNADGVVWFVDHVMPILERERPAMELTAVGELNSPELARRSLRRVSFLGRIDDLTPHYEAARVFVAPIRRAAGIQLKVTEAAGRGVPVVATDVVASGLGWADGIELLAAPASDPGAFAEQCLRLHDDETLWNAIRVGALSRVERDFHPGSFDRTVREALAL
jgi:glycosyltransferase involved in cell wall biosynthesis